MERKRRESQTPHIIAFLRENPNVAYSVQELEQLTGHSAKSLSTEAKKPGSQIIATPQRGMYMWTTTLQSKTNKPTTDLTQLVSAGFDKSGERLYKDPETEQIFRILIEEI